MFTTSVVLAGAVVALSAHCREYGFEMMSALRFDMLGLQRGATSKSRDVLDAAVWDIRVKQYLATARVYTHLTALAIFIFALGILVGIPSVSPLQLVICLIGWTEHYLISTKKITMSKITLRLALLSHYLQCLGFLYSFPVDCAGMILTSVLSATGGFTVAVLSADVWIAALAQLLLSSHEIWRLWKYDPDTAAMLFWYQLIVYVGVVSVTCLVESSARSRIAMLLNSESMVASVRQILCGLCDGELLLDGNLRVIGKAECLKRLLMTSEEFSSRSFEELLVEDERPRFLRFMSGNVESAAVSNRVNDADTRKGAPPCLRVSLLNRLGHRIGVDVFHVKIPHLFGEEAYHLVALREDFESRAAPEAPEEAAANFSPALERIEKVKDTKTDARSCSARSDSSVPQVSSTSLLQLCAELEEMTLLIDASTPLLDVEQAHLSFVRRSDESSSSMPSLRRIVRPTDWGTVRSQLREFALTAGSMESAAQQRDVLKMKLRMQDDAKRCIEAKTVEVSAFSPPAPAGSNELILKKLCLQIGGMKVVTKRQHRCGLQGVEEGQFDESEGEGELSP